MKRTIILILVLLIITALLLYYALTSAPATKHVAKPQKITGIAKTITPSPVADATLGFFPDSILLPVAGSASLDIIVNAGSNKITGVQLEIAYDPLVLEEVSIVKGNYLPASNVLFSEIDKTSGRVTYALVLPPTQSPVAGSGKVAVLNIKRNNNYTGTNSTSLTILPKSLVAALGVEGSVLQKTGSAVIEIQSSGQPSDAGPAASTPSALTQ